MGANLRLGCSGSPTLMIDTTTRNESLQWFCLRSEPKREHVAAANLRDRVLVDVFAPRIRASRITRGGMLVTSTEPLFPGYLFARFAYALQVRHVISTTGVHGVVSFGGQPPPVADPIIDQLRREVFAAADTPIAPVLEAGAWVRIVTGCFQFLEGRILTFDPRTDRVRLLLALLGGEVQVTLPSRHVAPLDAVQPHYPSGLRLAAPAHGAAIAGVV